MGLENPWTTPDRFKDPIQHKAETVSVWKPDLLVIFYESLLTAFFQFKDFSNKVLQNFKLFFKSIKHTTSVTK